MKTHIKRWRNVSGIQKRYLKYTLALLAVALLLSSVAVWHYVEKELTSAIVEKYEFMDEKMGISLDLLFEKSDEVLADCIVDGGVQESLKTPKLSDVEKIALSKYFAYVDLEDVSEYCYVDNKKNVYSRSYSKIDYADFCESGLAEQLGDSYAKTQWFRAEDHLFGKGEKAVFIGRYVHSMEYAHEPGMLFFKMENDYLEEIIDGSRNLASSVAIGVMDKNGEVWKSWYPEKYTLPQGDRDVIAEIAKDENGGMRVFEKKISSGILSAYRQKETGLVVYTIVPNQVLSQGLTNFLGIMGCIYLLVIAVAIVISIYFSNRFTRPIKLISREMSEFDGKDFSKTIQIETNTELDQIGKSYNDMLHNIEQLLKEIKEQERELRTVELDVLMSQINPHFLYNTLDTIYMLARINGEETTVKMIQALSKYLRLSLSKGSEIVTVEDELENVRSYMEIQQIRNDNLFRYEVECQVDKQKTQILKLILQPLVENSIKYGFCEIFEDGLIRIRIYEKNEGLQIEVYNSGIPIRQEIAERINSLNGKSVKEVKKNLPGREHGFGVMNVITRLRLKYGEDVHFEYQIEENGTNCIIWIPNKGEEYEED